MSDLWSDDNPMKEDEHDYRIYNLYEDEEGWVMI